MFVSRRHAGVACALLVLAAAPREAHAQFQFCTANQQTQEIIPHVHSAYQMFDDLFLRPGAVSLPKGTIYLMGGTLQVANSGRYQPKYGKCDPVTDRSLFTIQQLFPTSTPNVSGGATGSAVSSTGGSGASALRSAFVDEDVVVGFIDRGDFTTFHAFRWTLARGPVDLGTLDPANNATRTSMATATNTDGSVIVGFSQVNATTTQHAFRWTSAGMVDLGTPAGATRDSRATGVSAAGDVIVGDATFADANAFSGFRSGAFRWTAAGGFQNLGALEPSFFSIATRVSADGNTIVGQGGVQVRVGNSSTNGSRAFRWTSSGGMQPIGPLPGHTHAVATGVSDNGKLVVGISSAGPLSYNSGGGALLGFGTGTAFIWTESGGLAELRQDRISAGFTLAGITLVTATGLTGDGQYIVGDAVGPRTPANETRPYLMKRCDAANNVPCSPFQQSPVTAPDFALATSSATTATVAAGQNVTATLTVTPTGGFNQAVSFTCSGLPTTTACAFAPATVTPNAVATSTTLTISTTAPSRSGSGTIAVWSGTTGMAATIALGTLLLVAVSTRPRRRLAMAAGVIGVCASCGGGGDKSSGTTGPAPLTGGTTAGTYPIVVTATSGTGATAISKTLTITMTVTR